MVYLNLMQGGQQQTQGASKKSTKRLNLWVWWIGLTSFYTPLVFLAAATEASLLARVVTFIGLFVPIGPQSIFFSIIPKCGTIEEGCGDYSGLLIYPVVLAGLYLAEKLAKNIPFAQATPTRKVIFNLVSLLLLTMIADLLLFRKWTSLLLFLGGSVRL